MRLALFTDTYLPETNGVAGDSEVETTFSFYDNDSLCTDLF